MEPTEPRTVYLVALGFGRIDHQVLSAFCDLQMGHVLGLQTFTDLVRIRLQNYRIYLVPPPAWLPRSLLRLNGSAYVFRRIINTIILPRKNGGEVIRSPFNAFDETGAD